LQKIKIKPFFRYIYDIYYCIKVTLEYQLTIKTLTIGDK